MNRYNNTRKIKKENRDYYKTTIYQEIPESENDFFVLTQYGDRLDLLAHQFYGDSSLWCIARANNLIGLNIPTNIQLRIPGSTKYAQGK